MNFTALVCYLRLKKLLPPGWTASVETDPGRRADDLSVSFDKPTRQVWVKISPQIDSNDAKLAAMVVLHALNKGGVFAP